MIKEKKSKISTLTCKTTLQRILAVAGVDCSFNRSLNSWLPVSGPSIRMKRLRVSKFILCKDINERCKHSRRQQSSYHFRRDGNDKNCTVFDYFCFRNVYTNKSILVSLIVNCTANRWEKIVKVLNPTGSRNRQAKCVLFIARFIGLCCYSFKLKNKHNSHKSL